MTTLLRCSIIINTYNRAPYLERLLASFNHLTYEHFEVVVVNGPSTDGTGALLQKYIDRIKVVDCPTGNLSLSRNLGIAAAAGDIVLFIDDDALPAGVDWLDQIVAAFEADSAGRLGAAGGGALHRDTDYYEFEGGLTSDYGLQVFRSAEPGPQADTAQQWVRRTVGCNSAFRRSALQKIGGFDEYFTYYLDESDVCLRLARQGYAVAYLPDCAVRHYPAPSPHGEPFLRNRRTIARSDTYFSLKNGSDTLPKRLAKTIRLAPQKHFVREIPALWRNGQISTATVVEFGGQWLFGFMAGLAGGLFSRRRNRLSAVDPPPFLPFPKNRPPHKLRVCLLARSVPPDPKIGGVGRYTYNLAKGLHELGHEVHLICESEQPIRRHGLGFIGHGISAADCSGQLLFLEMPNLNRNVGYALAVGRKLFELGRQGIEIDVVHATNWDLEGLSLPLLKWYPYLLVLVSPLAEIIETEGWRYNDDLRALVSLDRWQIEQAKLVCCPSMGVLASYQEKLGLNLNQIKPHKIQLGIVPSLPPPDDSRGGRSRRLLFVGRLEYRKGAHILLEVLPQLLSQHSDWYCNLVGDNTIKDIAGRTLQEQFLQKHAGALWLSRVHFHGAVSDEALNRFYYDCDLFVAPSLFESFGLVYLEAMQYGKAVVGCNVAGIPEIVSHEVDGLLVEPNNASSLANALSRLMSDDTLRARFGEAGRRKVFETLNYLAMARRFVPLYQKLIADVIPPRDRPYRIIPLTDMDQVCRHGQWQIKEAVAGQLYVTSNNPADFLTIRTPANSVIFITCLRHNEGGVLTARINGTHLNYFDLYSATRDPNYQLRIDLPANPVEAVELKLEIHPERNPASKDTQVWLKDIIITLDVAS